MRFLRRGGGRIFMQDVVSLACVVALSGTNRCSLSYSERIRMLHCIKNSHIKVFHSCVI